MTAILCCESSKGEVAQAAGGPCSDTFFYSTIDEQRILNCLSACNEERLSALVQEIWQKNVAQKTAYRKMSRLFEEMYYTGIRFLEERGVPQEQIRLNDNNSSLRSGGWTACADPEQFEECLLDFYRTVMEIAGCRAKSRSDGLPGIIAEYVRKNYRENLSLEQIADEMNVSVKYVSRIFKEKTGVNLTAFINRVRMDEAKKLLLQTELSVNEVAERVGINSRTTFLRIFKKAVGITPNEYRTANCPKPQSANRK